MFESIVALCLGIGLAASCGFRVFVPFLVISISAKAGLLELGGGFEWISSWPALITFAVASVIETAAYYIPWLDNLLDVVSTPGAIIAGLVSVAACVAEFEPLLRWSLAAIAGGGIAGTVKLAWASIRVGSTATTGGAANSVVSTVEGIGATVLSLLAVLLPIFAAIVALVITFVVVRFAIKLGGRLWRRDAQQEPVSEKSLLPEPVRDD